MVRAKNEFVWDKPSRDFQALSWYPLKHSSTIAAAWEGRDGLSAWLNDA